jgi:hypothetical protein
MNSGHSFKRNGQFSSIKNPKLLSLGLVLAERKRFELSIQLPVYYLSRVAPSTTRTPLYFSGVQKYVFSFNANITYHRV